MAGTVDPNKTPREKTQIAKTYVNQLVQQHSSIESVILSGSVVRGDDLPISDVDIWVFTRKREEGFAIEKRVIDDVFLDVELYDFEDVTTASLLKDPYSLSFVLDSTILYDKSNTMRDFIEGLRAEAATTHYRRNRLESIRKDVVSNRGRFEAAVRENDPAGLCKSFIFFLWCLSEYILVRNNKAPGGFRCLARLKMVNTDSFLDILKAQESLPLTADDVDDFMDLCAPCHAETHGGSTDFQTFNMEKLNWLKENGFKDEAFHMLWILLGLRIKEGDEEAIGEQASAWIEKMQWNREKLNSKAHEMDALMSRYLR
jgi:predicted nucleotidyltransferase